MWSASLGNFEYALPEKSADSFAGFANDTVVIATDKDIIVAFILKLHLQIRPSWFPHGRIARLIAFDKSTGLVGWKRDVHVLEAHVSGPFLWSVRDVGYAVRSPSSIDVYSYSGMLLRSTAIDQNTVVNLSPSGHTILTAEPVASKPAVRTLTAIDIVKGRETAAVRSAYLESFAVSDTTIAFSIQKGEVDRILAIKRGVENTHKVAQRPWLRVGTFLSDSELLALDNQTMLVISETGEILASRAIKDKEIVLCGIDAGKFVLSQYSSNLARGKQTFSIYDSVNLNELFTLELPQVPTVRAGAAISEDGATLAVVADGLVTLYKLPSGHH